MGFNLTYMSGKCKATNKSNANFVIVHHCSIISIKDDFLNKILVIVQQSVICIKEDFFVCNI